MTTTPSSIAAILATQRARKRVAVQRAKAVPYYRGKLDHIDESRLDDPEQWRRIPILDKAHLRALTDEEFYRSFCSQPEAGIAEYWRSGGATGKPLFYPRGHDDMPHAMESFARIFDCIGLSAGERLHDSFPLGIHPVGHMFARAAQTRGIGVIWAGAGSTTPSAMQLELIQRLKPTAWIGMSSYALHLANLAESLGTDLSGSSVKTVICSAEPLSDAKREKIERSWGASVRDTFGMTEAGMMGAEDRRVATGGERAGFRVWTDLYFIEVVDPDSHAPVPDGEVGSLVVTPLWTNHCTPFLRWSSGDLVSMQPGQDPDSGGPGNPDRNTAAPGFSVFPLVRHAHRTTGFFKVRGVNINHPEFEDFMFRDTAINDFKCELLAGDGNDVIRVSVETRRGTASADFAAGLVARIKRQFEVTPEIVVLETGTLAREFEASVKAPRFADRR